MMDIEEIIKYIGMDVAKDRNLLDPCVGASPMPFNYQLKFNPNPSHDNYEFIFEAHK